MGQVTDELTALIEQLRESDRRQQEALERYAKRTDKLLKKLKKLDEE